MFGIDGHKSTRRTRRGGHARRTARCVDLGRHGHNKIAAHDQAFFIRKRKHLASGERLIARTQTGGAHQSVHHNVGLFDARERSNRLGAKADLHAAMRVREARVTRKLRIAERDIAHAELMRLSKHGIDAGVGREGDYLQLVGMATGHIERLRADRARRSQNNNLARHAAFIRMSRISHFKPPLIRSESKALPRQKPMSRARSSIQTPRKIPPGPTRAAESNPKRIASTFYAPPGPAQTDHNQVNRGQSRPSKTDPARSKPKAPRRIAPALDARDAARA